MNKTYTYYGDIKEINIPCGTEDMHVQKNNTFCL